MGLFRAVSIRVAVGLFITLMGFFAAMATGNLNIFTNWTSGFGFFILVLAGIPFMGPSVDLKALRLAKDKNKAIADMEQNREQLMGWSLSLVLVALPVVVLPTIVYMEFLR